MEGIIFLVALIPIAILVLLIIFATKSSSQQDALKEANEKLDVLYSEFRELKTQIQEFSKKSAPVTTTDAIKEEPKPIFKPPVIPKEEPPVIIPEKKPLPQEKAPVPEPIQLKEPVAEPVLSNALQEEEKTIPPVLDEEFEKKTDWEKVIGENLANKIGIGVLVLGIAFFVKFAIDKNWINEVGRVIIGLLSGGILIGLAHYTRNSYRSFSSVLVGGGLTVFYFTIAFAFHEYHLIGQNAAFIIMIIITAFAVLMSLLYNRLELAVLATIGGFITPFLVSTGQNNYIALFTYLSILNTGLLVLAWFKRWKAINIIALVFTVIIFGGWLINANPERIDFRWALLFASIFYTQFVSMNIINNLKLKMKFGALDFITLLTINSLYYASGMIILDHLADGEYKGLFTASLGIINMILAWMFFKQNQADRNFIYLLIGLTLTFISLAAPVQLSGNYITLFWAAEAVVLFWLYQRSRIVLLKIASPLVVLLMLISLFMDWSQVYVNSREIIPIIANKGFITTMVAATSVLLYYIMMRREADTLYLPEIENKFIRTTLMTIGVLLLYAAGVWEIFYQFSTRLPGTGIFTIYFQLYTFLFITVLLLFLRKSPSFLLVKLVLTLAAMIFYLFQLTTNYEVSSEILKTGSNRSHFIAHWAAAIMLGYLLYDLVVQFRRQRTKLSEYVAPFTWIASSCLVFLLSVEIYHAFMWINYPGNPDWYYWENLYYKAGLSIVWGLCSFAMMWLGMKYKFKALRIISLSLFTITLVKLFFYDIQNIPPGGKIAAFILLGVLLLIISFMYQRLKKMIIDDQQKA